MNRMPSRFIALTLSLALFVQPVWSVSRVAGVRFTPSAPLYSTEAVVPWMIWVGQRLEISDKAPFWARRMGARFARFYNHHPEPSRLLALRIAEELPLRDASDKPFTREALRQEFIRRLVPREPSKANDTAIRQAVFRHMNGLVLIPTLVAMSYSSIKHPHSLVSFLQYIDRHPGVLLRDLSEQFNPTDPNANAGYKYAFLRTLVLQGWVTLNGKDGQSQYALTPLGRRVLQLAEAHQALLRSTNAFYRNSHRLYELFRKPELTHEEFLSLQHYHELIDRSKRRWIPDAGTWDPLGQQAVDELRDSLDGVLLAPTLVALAIQADGIDPIYDPQVDSYRVGSHLDMTYNAPFLFAAYDLLASAQPFGKSLGHLTEGDFSTKTFTYSDDGKDFMRRAGSYGVPASYIKAYQMENVRGMLFDSDNPDPAGIGTYHHFDPIVNGWGTGATHTTFLSHLLGQALPMIELGAHGVVEMGAGSGKLVSSIGAAAIGWKRVLERIVQDQTTTLMPSKTSNDPFVIVGADVTSKARTTTWNRLATLFGDVPSVFFRSVYGDVTDPAKFARTLEAVAGVRAEDMIHMMMFVIEERHFSRLTGFDADRIFREQVNYLLAQETGADDLHAQLRRMGALGANEPLPAGPELIQLVIDQFDISMSDLGRLVPAKVAAADLIQFMERFAEVNPFGILALDVCTTGIDQLAWRDGVQPDVNYYGTHLLREKVFTEDQRALAYLLAGFRFTARKPIPDKGKGPDGRGVPLVGFSRLSQRMPNLMLSGADTGQNSAPLQSYAIPALESSTQRVRHEAEIVAKLLGAAFGASAEQVARVVAETNVEFFLSPAQSNAGHGRIQIHRLLGVQDKAGAYSLLSTLASEMGHRFHQVIVEDNEDRGVTSAVAEAYDAISRVILMHALDPFLGDREITFLNFTAVSGELVVQALHNLNIPIEEFLGGGTGRGADVMLEVGRLIRKKNPNLHILGVRDQIERIAIDFFYIPPAGMPILPYPASHLIGNWILSKQLTRLSGNWKEAARLMGGALTWNRSLFGTVTDFQNMMQMLETHLTRERTDFQPDSWVMALARLRAFVQGVNYHPILLPTPPRTHSPQNGPSPREVARQMASELADEITRKLFPDQIMITTVIENWGTFREIEQTPQKKTPPQSLRRAA